MWESQVRILSRVPELSLKRWKEMPKALDLKGQRFGKLIAIKKAKSKNGKTYWLCRCDCGEYKEIQTCHLTSGTTQSCGRCKENPLFQAQEN